MESGHEVTGYYGAEEENAAEPLSSGLSHDRR
jgi:hypothetical protein